MITPFKQKKESENIDIDAAARGLVTALTGKTEFDGVDYTFTQKSDAEAFEKQRQRNQEVRDYINKNGLDGIF